MELYAKRLIISIFLILCNTQNDVFANESFDVYVSVPPLAYIAEQIGGDSLDVHVMLPESQDPHTFEPTPSQILALDNAQLFFSVGMSFEKRVLAKINNYNTMQIVDTTAGINKRQLTPGQEAQIHGGDDHIDDSDPHVWLAPPLVKILAKNMSMALIKKRPKYREKYQRNLSIFLLKVNSIHNNIEKLLKPLAGKSFYVFHPAFGYFGDTYGLHQQAVEVGGKMPSPKQLSKLIDSAISDNVKFIFVQPQFDRKSATAIAKTINGAVVEMNPMPRDLLTNFEDMTQKIRQGLMN